MDDLAERIQRSVVVVHTPNEQVFAELRGERQVRVWLAPGHYERVSTGKLQEELATLGRLLFAAALKEHKSALHEVTGGRVFTPRVPVTDRDHEYDRTLREMLAEGVSDDGTVRVTAVGQQNYSVQIEPGTLDRVSQLQFETSCAQAAERLIADTEGQAARARWEIYKPLGDIDLPA